MNDLISRQAAIEVLLTAAHINLSDGQAYFLEKALNEIPSAQPERKKGRWTVTSLFIKCSECGEAFMLMPQNYCPNCGADMRGEDE